MAIEKIEARTPLGALLVLSLTDPTNGYLVKEVDGLDPVKATISSTTFAGVPGTRYQSSRREARNIIIKLGLAPDFAVNQTVRQLRTALYEFFDSDSEVSLRFYMADGLTVDIHGRVETCDAPLFVKDPEAVISIMCFAPDFEELTPTVVSGNTVSTTTEFTIDYPSKTKVGFVFRLTLNRSLSAFTIYQRPTDNVTRTFDFAASLLTGDILTISSINGEKAVTLNRGGTLSSLMYGKSPQSKWLQLEQGSNHLRVYATGAAIPFTISYTPRYGGL